MIMGPFLFHRFCFLRSKHGFAHPYLLAPAVVTAGRNSSAALSYIHTYWQKWGLKNVFLKARIILLLCYPELCCTFVAEYFPLFTTFFIFNLPTFGTFFIQVDAPFETIRYCGFEWWNNCVQCWFPKWF